MEEWEGNHIKRNLSNLLKVTNCNTELLAELNDIFSDVEIYTVEAEKTPPEKANTLYKTAITKLNGYHKLALALQASKQTGALKIILEGYQLNSKSIPEGLNGALASQEESMSTKMPRKLEDRVLGDDDCTRSDVVAAIKGSTSFGGLDGKWKSVARNLGIPDHEITKLEREQLIGLKSLEDVIDKILALWREDNASDAKIIYLCDTLKSCGLTDIAETLATKFGK